MNVTDNIKSLIKNGEGETLEFKAVLPPSKSIARLISSFANTNGGYIILGIADDGEIVGLSDDFRANSITHKAIDSLSPKPTVGYEYVNYDSRKLYVIKVEKSDASINLGGEIFIRVGASTRLEKPNKSNFKTDGYTRIVTINNSLEAKKVNGTSSKESVLQHYQSVLRLLDDLGHVLYPKGVDKFAVTHEGKILTRILFSSFADSFEGYLSDLLYEIFLANPETLKSEQKVTIKEVLDCADIQEFISYWSKQKISKLQRGSVKGFIKDNKQIKDLNAIDSSEQIEIERILQIRHLYSHRNGIVDEKFLKYFPGEYLVNTEYQISIKEFCDKLCYLIDIIEKIDKSAILKYKLGIEN